MLARVPRSIAEAPAEELTPAGLRLALGRISSRPVMQNSVLRFFKAAVRWAAREEMIPPSPVERMSLPHHQAPRDHVLAPDEIVAVWRSAEQNVMAHPRQGLAVAALVKILVLLGRGRAHLIPLPPLAVTILTEVQQVTGKRERVFHKVSYNAREFWTHPIRNRSMEMGAAYWKLHDLRRTCATNLGDLGLSDDLVALVLGHSRKDVTGRVYNLSKRLPECATALARWATSVEGLLAATPELPRKRRRPRSSAPKTARRPARTTAP
jgi:integrase